MQENTSKLSARDRNKLQTRRAILSATRNILVNGEDNKVTMEIIAERSGVGVATVYNYFGTKNDLILELVREDLESMLEKTERAVAADYDKVEDAIVNALRPSFELELIRVNSTALPQFMNDFWRETQDPRKESIRALLKSVEKHIESVLQFFQQKQLLPDDLDTTVAASILFALVDYNYLSYARGELQTASCVSEKTNKQVRLLVVRPGSNHVA